MAQSPQAKNHCRGVDSVVVMMQKKLSCLDALTAVAAHADLVGAVGTGSSVFAQDAPAAVNVHVANILDHLAVHSQQDAVTRALDLGLLWAPPNASLVP